MTFGLEQATVFHCPIKQSSLSGLLTMAYLIAQIHSNFSTFTSALGKSTLPGIHSVLELEYTLYLGHILFSHDQLPQSRSRRLQADRA